MGDYTVAWITGSSGLLLRHWKDLTVCISSFLFQHKINTQFSVFLPIRSIALICDNFLDMLACFQLDIDIVSYFIFDL
jgi:hypothetical protein